MKTALAVLFLASSAFASSHVEQAKAYTVLVTNEGFLGGGRGSGVLLDKDHVLTCAHMADTKDDEFFVYTYPLGQVVRAHVLARSVQSDLMILLLEKPVKMSKYPTFQTDVEDGEHVTVVGNALGSMKWVVTSGIISGAERGYLLTDARINPGNSGGPWLNDRGQIVALTDWGIGPNTKGQLFLGIEGGISAVQIGYFVESLLAGKIK